jgi:phosphatidylglycerol:prolipoprotein diacylglycerol transferase
MFIFPNIDPVALQIGPLAIRWYSLAYVAGILIGWWIVKWIDRKNPLLSKQAYDDIIVYAIVGIMLGGRLGYVLFYQYAYYLEYPLEALKIWHGGMSFHGGLIGFLTAFALFCRKHKIAFLTLCDRLAVVAPIGIFFGRIANFINGELYGRITDSPLGMVFPKGGELPRYPSQLFEAFGEGLLLFVILFSLAIGTRAKERTGLLGGIFLLGYAVARSIVEQFREPDEQLGFFFGSLTMGQMLSAPMMIAGVYLLFYHRRKAA